LRILGLDIGGAHIKSALKIDRRGGPLPKRRTHGFEIYKTPNDLLALLEMIRRDARPDHVALTMTGELSDVFPSRRAGVRWIVNTVTEVMKGAEVRVVDVAGNLISPSLAVSRWEAAASANWAATAGWVARHLCRCVIVDIGSTTTDILPVIDGATAVRGKTDLERLKTGELIYTGYLRTNAAHVLPEIKIGGAVVSTCPEYFAIMGDVHLCLGEISAKSYTTSTPDGRSKTKRASAARLARLVLSDPKTLGERGVQSIARQIRAAQVERIAEKIKKITTARALEDASVVLIGPGKIYGKDLRARLKNPFIKNVGGASVNLIDPASCAAALWED